VTGSRADRAALSDLVHRYAAHVDDRQFAQVTTLFTESAELLVPDPPATLEPVHSHRGRDAIGAAVAAVAQTERTEHAVVGEVYHPGAQPGTASGRISCVAHHWNRRPDTGEAVDVVWHLRYDDEYVLAGAGWLISRRVLTINAIETRPVRRLR
jgi:hypothetical protein